MSGKLLFDVMDCDGLKPAMKLLLVALADRADEAGVSWPSRADLSLRMGLSFSTITRTARALEAGQWLQRKQRFDATTVYRLNVAKIQACASQCRAARKLRKVTSDWEPFPEELAAQAVENKGEGHFEPGSGHFEPGSGHGEPQSGHGDTLTSQEPLKNLKGPAALSLDFSKMTEYQRSEVRNRDGFKIQGVSVRRGSFQADQAAVDLRAWEELLRSGSGVGVACYSDAA